MNATCVEGGMLEISTEAAEMRNFKILSWIHLKINNDTQVKLSLLI
jgi:hypothetical protein